MFWIELLLAVILTELITELVIKSIIFKPIRERIKKLHNCLEKLLSCGYCFSIWAAFGVVFLLQPSYNLTGTPVLDWSLVALVVHRLSNYLHNFNDKFFDKYYSLAHINSGHSDVPEKE